jgi:hypothetical protein
MLVRLQQLLRPVKANRVARRSDGWKDGYDGWIDGYDGWIDR